MKNMNLIALGGATVLLTACGANNADVAKDENICDAYIAYTQCTLEESGMDADSIKTVLEQTKSAWAQLPQDQMEEACTQAIAAIKMSGVEAGSCALPEVDGDDDMEDAIEDMEDELEDAKEDAEEKAEELEEAAEDAKEDAEEKAEETMEDAKKVAEQAKEDIEDMAEEKVKELEKAAEETK